MLGLLKAHAVDADVAVSGTEVELAFDVNRVRSRNGLQPGGLRECKLEVRDFEAHAQVLHDGFFGLHDGHARDGHGTVVKPQIDLAFRIDGVAARDRLHLGKIFLLDEDEDLIANLEHIVSRRPAADHLNGHNVQRFQMIGRQGHHPRGIDEQDVGGLDDVLGEVDLGELPWEVVEPVRAAELVRGAAQRASTHECHQQDHHAADDSGHHVRTPSPPDRPAREVWELSEATESPNSTGPHSDISA